MEENYKEKQKKYKELYKNRGRTIWYSTDPTNPLAKGKTFVIPKEIKQEDIIATYEQPKEEKEKEKCK